MFGRSREVQVLREALLWYATREVYSRRGKHAKGAPVRYDHAPIIDDKGIRARKALNKADALRWYGLPRRLSILLAFRFGHVPPLDITSVAITVPDPLPREDRP
jgi:hypothetical protein